MKKKIKLFSTIASLCLAVALMAFGVYAATTESYKINNNVIYNIANNALVKIEATVKPLNETYKNSKAVTALADVAAIQANEYWNGATSTNLHAAVSTYDPTEHTYVDAIDASGYNYTFNFETSYAYKVEIKITTVNTNGVNIKWEIPSITAQTYTILGESNTTGEDIDSDDTDGHIIVYYVQLKDVTVPIVQSTDQAVLAGSVSVTIAPK